MEVSSSTEDPTATEIKEKLKDILQSLILYQEKSLSNKSDGELVMNVFVFVLTNQLITVGCAKFMTCIKSEIKFLERLENDEQIANPIRNGSNYHFLSSVFGLAERYGGADRHVELLKLVKYEKKETVRIDLVVNNGARWICVKSRRNYKVEEEEADSEEDDSEDDGDDSDETLKKTTLTIPDNKLVKQAKSLLMAAQKSPIHFKTPEVVFQFVRLETGGLPLDLHKQLEDLGIRVLLGQDVDLQVEEARQISSIANLDIPTLVAMVSCITFDFPLICEEAFDSPPLQHQSRDELDTPLLPALQKLLAGKTLVCVEDAFNKFADIISTIGGEREKQRAFHLFKHALRPDELDIKLCTILSPNLNHLENNVECVFEASWKIYVIPNDPSDRFKNLHVLSTSFQNLNIFGTADKLAISTITANGKFLRSLEKVTGLKHSAVVHQPRGLIEQKWIKYSRSNRDEV